ncbi:guanine deaminase [Bailinhaonella thermotolerans]|uniref:guanine deaminase n=1 Tax=Bailinhaonella thermotolerans TaxID=1070861 RepID=UPI00192A3448|nr:guanine deaminase [Bailinhaonella thermotolerans]
MDRRRLLLGGAGLAAGATVTAGWTGPGGGHEAAGDGPVCHRGTVLHFTGDPGDREHGNAHTHLFEDGALVVHRGHVVYAGPWESRPPAARVADHRGHLILPGFIDTHIHSGQIDAVASPGGQLLPWLKKYIYPAEMRFEDRDYAAQASWDFLNILLSAGTTTAAVHTTTYPQSTEAFFDQALRLNLRMVAGKVLMDSGGGTVPDAYLDRDWRHGQELTRDLIERYNGRRGSASDPYGSSRLCYCITPRFAPTSTLRALKAAGELYREFAGKGEPVWAQSHLAENRDEIDLVMDLFCDAFPGRRLRSYLDVYDRCGLVGPRTIWAHCVWPDHEYHPRPRKCRHRHRGPARDRQVLRARGAGVSFCPTSNLFLGSGFFRLHRTRDAGVPVGLGTDIGAGTSYSLLHTLGDAYKAVQLGNGFPDRLPEPRRHTLTALRGLYLATRGGAEALRLQDRVGSFQPGMEADFVVLDLGATPALRRRVEAAQSVHDRLFALTILGDERCTVATYVLGHPVYQRGHSPYTPFRA